MGILKVHGPGPWTELPLFRLGKFSSSAPATATSSLNCTNALRNQRRAGRNDCGLWGQTCFLAEVTRDGLPTSLGQSPSLWATAPRGAVLRQKESLSVTYLTYRRSTNMGVTVRKNIFLWKICLRNSYQTSGRPARPGGGTIQL